MQDIKIKETVVNQKKFLGKTKNSVKIYRDVRSFSFISPFNFVFDQIDRLFLVNFEGDSLYFGIELQIFVLEGKEYPLVILYRKDGLKDLYYTNKYVLEDREDILKDLLIDISFNQPDQIEFNLDVDDSGLKCKIFLKDKFEREIEIIISENFPNRKLYSFLVPSTDSREPSYFPLVYLKQFGMIVKENTAISLNIDREVPFPIEIPFKLEGKNVYLSRFSFTPIICNWNNAFEGFLDIINVNLNSLSIKNKNVTYELIENNRFYEIKTISASDKNDHTINIEFSPPIPNLLSLKENVKVEGKFSNSIDEKEGIFAGEYEVTNSGKRIIFTLHPTKGWQPSPGKLWLQAYKWIAELKVIDEDTVECKSYWKKVK